MRGSKLAENLAGVEGVGGADMSAERRNERIEQSAERGKKRAEERDGENEGERGIERPDAELINANERR